MSLPEAFINMVALLGWSPANDREVLTLEEMIAEFDLHKVHKAGARFNKEKAEWFNSEYLRAKSDEEVLELLKKAERITLENSSDAQLLKIISLMKERATFVRDIYTEGIFFFEAPTQYEEKAVKKAWNEAAVEVMSEFSLKLQDSVFEPLTLKQDIHDFAESKGLGMGKVMMPLRLCLVGELKGPDVPDIMQILGKEETIARIKNAVNNIQ